MTDKGYVITRDGENVYLSAHQHNWTYTASGNTITATCKGCVANDNRDYSGGTLTIKAPDDLTYNGKAKAATVTASDDWKGENTENIIVNYIKQGESTSSNIAPINAGTYTASVTLGEKTASVEYTIQPKEVTVAAGDYKISKAYDGTTSTGTASGALSVNGILTGDDVIVTTTPAEYSEANVATGSMNVAIALQGTGAANYQIKDNATTVSVPCEITQATITVKPKAGQSKTYGDNDPELKYDVSGCVNNETAAFEGLLSRADGNAVGIYAINIGTLKLKDNGNFKADNYRLVLDSEPVNFTINKRNVTITGLTVSDREYNGSAEATVEGSATLSWKADGDDVNINAGKAMFADKNVGVNKTVTFSGYSLSGRDFGNYNLAQPDSVTATISPKEVTFNGVTATTREYSKDNKYVALTGGAVNGVETGDTVSVDLTNAKGTMADDRAGENKEVTISGVTLTGADAGNYTLANVDNQSTAKVTITKAIYSGDNTASGSAKYGASGTVDLSSMLVEGGTFGTITTQDTDSVLSGNATISDNKLNFTFVNDKSNADKTATVTIPVTSTNYIDYSITVTLKVLDKLEQSDFKFAESTKTVTYGDDDFAVTTTGQVDGSNVTYESSNTNVATVDENSGKVHIIGAGKTTITATASETDDYNAATATYELTVNKKQIAVPAADTTGYTYNGTEQTYKLDANDAYTIEDNKQTNANETGYTVTVALKDTDNTKWNDDTTAEKTYTFVISKAAVTITVKDKTAYVNADKPDLTNPKLGEDYTVSGLVGNDPLETSPKLKYVDADGNEATPDMTKTGDTIIRASNADAGSNYTIKYEDGKLTVSNRPSGGHTKNTDVITTGDKVKTTTSPAEVKTDGADTATAAVSKANQEEILKQAKDNKSSDIVLDISDKDTKGADNIQLELPKSMIDAIANDTAADLTINTEHGKLTVDKDTLDQLSKDAKGSTLRIIITKIKEPTAEQQKLAGDNVQPYRLTIMSGNQTIGSFAGKITVRLPIPEILKDKTVAAVHFDSDGKLTEMPGKRMMIDGIEYYVFETTHFSEFGLVDAVEAGLVKTDDSKGKVKEAKSIVSKMNLTAVTSKTTKKNVKVTVTMNKKTSSDIKALKELGYTVKYRFYRSTKKSAGYKSKITKKTNTYINTAGKKGTRYYYKAQVRVYDSKGKLITTTALKQCSYGTRTWSK